MGDIVCTNVRVEFLPPNNTAFLQPMDAGIIATFKLAFRRKQLLWVFDKIKRGDNIDKKAYEVDQLQAMQWSKAIWAEMSGKSTVANCFRHTGIIFNGVHESDSPINQTSYGADAELEDVIIRASQLSL
ncbi:unnamed protein product [Phytophthora lilii]|uniref:Unnamed protein product n=1 Tax=Phytophthora lilii TaxID=2077276 RepID=A0A9W6YI65_9STRA|nr:unnamed protein product [Phytophthora lilii]